MTPAQAVERVLTEASEAARRARLRRVTFGIVAVVLTLLYCRRS